jgi:pyruvate dehydrogenase E2 component (dihydrolipoamide acetyltransferase)
MAIFTLALPDIGEGVVEAEVQQWFVRPGDQIHEDQPVVEVMTDKATVVIPSPRRGRVARLCFDVGQVAPVHAGLLVLELEEEAPRPAAAPPVDAAVAAAGSAAGQAAQPAAAREAPPSPAPRAGARALATPAVRAQARSMGLDVNQVPGTGPGGRVTKEDLSRFKVGRNGHAAPGTLGSAIVLAPAAAPSAAPAPAPAAPPADAAEERIPLRGLRKRIAENMARSKRTAAHFTFVEQVDVTELRRVKERMAGAAEGVKLTYLPLIVKAVVAALRKHPTLNAALDEERGELVLKRRYDIGIAAATDAGLLVPVVRDADRRSIVDLAREIDRLSAAAKAGQSRPEDMGRSTFTVTSLGALGGLFATPVLNYPEVGILGVHRIRPTPVVRDGQVVVRDVMHLSVTSDHRVVDGAAAAAFAYEVIRYLEAPDTLFMTLA